MHITVVINKIIIDVEKAVNAYYMLWMQGVGMNATSDLTNTRHDKSEFILY